ncbi:hypothetical protein M9Q43_11370 [Flavobacterium sp. HXWNR29]|uniref:hypothetical protein n=1 Tax=Flavobacterium odoriferum TaxID=2946604 RepID=UPI0021CAE66D|nr:hypothetical protein [Flavobacterium sp. HXWNR29]MCU4189758.1 hypothetical protein [Flavobacterium sp. HXWNR29]
MQKTVFLVCLFHFFSFSQTVNKEKIAQSIDNYYQFERENIHLHLNKTVFLSNETIWFKGYIYDKKTNSLNIGTTNVYVSLYNSKRKELSNNLFFASNGTIDGQINLPKELESGMYYLHVYTNFMNNFEEDESTYQEIEIIVPKQINATKSYDKNNVTVSINYEGGNLITDCDNNVVVKISDCLNKGIKIENIKVLDEKQNVITTFSTNKLGYGKFILPKVKDEIYSIVSNNNFINFSEKLKKPSSDNFNLLLEGIIGDSYTLEIRANPNTLKKYENEELFLLIQKDRATRFITFKIQKNVISKFTLDKKNFFEGVNILRLIDKNLNQISERIIYKKENSTNAVSIISHTKTNDSIKIIGKLNNLNSQLSISALPFSTSKSIYSNSILKTLAFDNYLTNKINPELLNSKTTSADFDLFLISNTSKYNWQSILNIIPNIKYEFETGIDLTIRLNNSNSSKATKQLKIFSTNGISETTTMNPDSDFVFKNILALDSISIHYNFPKKPDLANKTTILHTLKKNKSKFNKLNTIDLVSNCELSYSDNSNDYDYNNSEIKTTELKNVEVVQNVKQKLLYTNFPSTRSAQAYKITEVVSDTYKDVLSFIASHQYDVIRDSIGNTVIVTRNKRSFLGNRYPIVLLDNGRIYNINDLVNFRLINVDEIYINNRGAGMGQEGMNGVISIFTKKQPTFNPLPETKNSNFFYITNGFKNVLPFVTSEKLSNQSEAVFKEYGTLDFTRTIQSNTNGIFEYQIPLNNQKKIILNVQGIDDKGQLYNQDIELEIK